MGAIAGAGPGPGAELPARWAAGEIGKVVARFSNPLRVPLELQRVEAVLDGSSRVQVFPTRVELPPKAEFYEVRDWLLMCLLEAYWVVWEKLERRQA